MDKINGVQLEEIKNEGTPMVEVIPPSSQRSSSEFNALFKKQQFKINRVPMDSRPQSTRWGGTRSSGVRRDPSKEEIEEIIRGGDIAHIRELSRFYYRTNRLYRQNIDYLAALPLYETVVVPIFETSQKGSQVQIIKAFYNACEFVEKLDVKNTFSRITREWLKSGIYCGILQEKGGKLVITDLPIGFTRVRYKDYYNLNILEFSLQYFVENYRDEEEREAVVATYPEVVQRAWRRWKTSKQNPDKWVEIPASQGGVCFTFTEDQTPPLLASIPDLLTLKTATGREEKRDENELYKLLIQRMPIDNDGELVFELDEVADIHAGVAKMLQDLDTVDVLTTFGETTLENLQDSSAASQSADRIEKYSKNAWDALGRSSLLFNANNSTALAMMIKKDESLMKAYLNMYNTWIKYHLNSRFSRTGLTFDFEILPITMFNMEQLQGRYFEGAQYGYSKMYAGVAGGIKQLAQISLMTFENDFLKMTDKMIPLQSSYTSTGDEKNGGSAKKTSTSTKTQDLNNTGGRPQLSDDQKSEKTQANIESKGKGE